MKNDKLEKGIESLNQDELEEAINIEKESVEEPKEEIKEEVAEEVKEEPKEEPKELVEGQPPKEEEKIELPEKYRDKKIEDIIHMHQESEKLMHGKAQEASRYRKMLEEKYDFDQEGQIVGVKESKPQPQVDDNYWNKLEEATGLPKDNLMNLMQFMDFGFQQRLKVYDDKLKPLQESQAKNQYESVKKSLKSDLIHLDKFEKEMDAFVTERKIPMSSLGTKEAITTIYNTILGQHYDEVIEKKKTENAVLSKVSEEEKDQAQLETTTKTVTEGKKDINTMNLDELEKLLPQQEIE